MRYYLVHIPTGRRWVFISLDAAKDALYAKTLGEYDADDLEIESVSSSPPDVNL